MATLPGKGGMVVTAFNITTSDTVLIKNDAANTKHAYEAVAMYVKTAGDISFLTPEDTVITLTAVPVNTVVGGSTPFLAKRVNATGTTAVLVAIAPLF